MSRRRRRAADERGAVAIIVAVCMTLLLVTAAMVLDFGLVRLDRQVNKSAADSATLAGLHALGDGDGVAHSYSGVCTAIRYLKTNDRRFAALPEDTGWKNGLGASVGNGCTATALRRLVCTSTDKSTWAVYNWSGSWQGTPLSVRVESGYSLTGGVWPEDSLPASSSDTGDSALGGCDQLAVTISESRRPGLGSLATSSDLETSLRSVGRVRTVAGAGAAALLLLQRTGCPVLTTGNSGGGSGTFIHVLGTITSRGTTQPGTIHADSDGAGCSGGSNSNIFLGAQDSGIVAYAAPLASNPSLPDPAKPGFVSSVAALYGASATVVRDSLNNVYGSTALTAGGGRNEVQGRSLIGRRLADERYLPAVRTAVSGAAAVFSSGSSGAPSGWTTLSSCNPTQAQVAALNLTAASALYVNCTSSFSSAVVIPAGRVYFRGTVSPSSGTLSLPNATRVYIDNTGNAANAINLGNNSTLAVNDNSANLSPSGNCSTGQSPSKAVLFVRSGGIKESNGGLLRLCRTTNFMMSGRFDGCLPTVNGTAPVTTPCAGVSSGVGNGQLTQTGGGIDWTAPNTLDATIDPATQQTLPAALAAWGDPNGPEDLALWDESSTTNSATFNMNGSGLFALRGVFMVPNAQPFKLSGGAGMNLTDAQYIVSAIELNGGTQITMAVNPDSAVTLPDLSLVGLVR